jgi:hypothetical protein
MELINQSIVQTSFEKLIKILQLGEPENEEHKKDIKIKSQINVTKKKTMNLNSSSINKQAFSRKNEKKTFLNTNFCNENCYEKFSNIVKKLKLGEVDLNKINWSSSSSNIGENSDSTKTENLIQNLVNYYYSLGYNQAINEMSNK